MNIYDSRTEAAGGKVLVQRIATLAQRSAELAIAQRCTIATLSLAQRSDNYLDYRSAAQRMCERTITRCSLSPFVCLVRA